MAPLRNPDRDSDGGRSDRVRHRAADPGSDRISLNGAARPGAGEIRGPLWTVVACKNVVHPALAWVVAGPLLGLTGMALLAAVVCAALPTAQNVFGYAVRYDRGVVLARDAALTTTIVGVPAMIGVVALVS